MPSRIQRRRTPGYRLPEGVVYVGRGSRWGNPYVVHRHSAACDTGDCSEWAVKNREQAVTEYRHAVLYPVQGQPRVPSVEEIREGLASRDLACWCPLDVECHGDVLLRIAAGEEMS